MQKSIWVVIGLLISSVAHAKKGSTDVDVLAGLTLFRVKSQGLVTVKPSFRLGGEMIQNHWVIGLEGESYDLPIGSLISDHTDFGAKVGYDFEVLVSTVQFGFTEVEMEGFKGSGTSWGLELSRRFPLSESFFLSFGLYSKFIESIEIKRDSGVPVAQSQFENDLCSAFVGFFTLGIASGGCGTRIDRLQLDSVTMVGASAMAGYRF